MHLRLRAGDIRPEGPPVEWGEDVLWVSVTLSGGGVGAEGVAHQAWGACWERRGVERVSGVEEYVGAGERGGSRVVWPGVHDPPNMGMAGALAGRRELGRFPGFLALLGAQKRQARKTTKIRFGRAVGAGERSLGDAPVQILTARNRVHVNLGVWGCALK
jgi:hypothetical protein